ncbi:hypothetical protein [Amycolatopsis sp. La24]|uniref:hypothetical protein n=1 Tax=Amycolatopsis sp. La24 TaxID=3028304 RepID=UPI0023AEB0C9|nr:hypothetical protein [Amycolatopsis sp. La24]
MITIISGKGAPGATTTLAALAATWPAPVVLADCDPDGGDLARGWFGQWLLAGQVRADVGVLSHATATRHATAGDPTALIDHVQAVPPVQHVGLLAGLSAPGQRAAVGPEGWTRLTVALAAFKTRTGRPADALVDVGRFGAATPWPLVQAADLVLVAVRPTQRHVLAARPLLEELAGRVAPEKLALAVCVTTQPATREVRAALGHEVAVGIPEDTKTAAVLSDGHGAGALPHRSALLRAVFPVARRLHGTYHRYTPAEIRTLDPRPVSLPLIGGTQ